METYAIIAYYAVLLPNMCVLPRKLCSNTKDYCLCMIIYYLFMEFPTFYIPKLRLVARFARDIMIAELRARDAALDPSFGSAHVGGSFMLAQAAQSKEAQAGPSPVTVAAPGGQPLARMGLPVGRVTNRHLGISKT